MTLSLHAMRWFAAACALILALSTLVANADVARAGGAELKGWAVASTPANGTLAIAPTTHIESGDLLVAVVSVQGRQEVTAGDGWSLVRTDSRANELTQTVWARRAGANEPSSYVWSDNVRRAKSGALLVVADATIRDLEQASSGASSHQSRPIAAPAITAQSDDVLLLGMYSMNANGPIASPSTMNPLGNGIKSAVSLTVATELVTKTGATGERAATRGSSGGAVGQLLVLQSVTTPVTNPTEPTPEPEDGDGGEHGDGHDHGGDGPGDEEEVEAPDTDAEVTVTGSQPDGFTVPAGKTWEIKGEVTTPANVVVYGTLKMRAGATLTFVDVDESAFVGPGDVTAPVADDVGLWVFGSGQLDIQGTPKQAWNRTGTHATWTSADEYAAAPNHKPGAKPLSQWKFGDPVPCVEFAGEEYCTEIANLTRDVTIQGTASGQSHIYVRSNEPQTIRYASLRHLGPNGNEVFDGRYALHFHMMNDGSRGSLIEGVVVRDTGDHAFVPHHSHGMTFRDTVAYNVHNTPYWWDKGHETNDTLYERALAIDVHRARDTVANLNGFRMGKGVGNACVECVAAGVSGGRSSAGFGWNDSLPNKWELIDSVAHNNNNGVYHWVNEPRSQGDAHEQSGFLAYHNSNHGIEQGAYVIQSIWEDTVMFGNGWDALINRGSPRGDFEAGISYRGGIIGGDQKTYPISVHKMKSCPAEGKHIEFRELHLLDWASTPIYVNKPDCDLHGGVFDLRMHDVVVGPDKRDLRPDDFTIDALPADGRITVHRTDGSTFTIRG